VEAADIQTWGLGGDSKVKPEGTREIRVGPERVIPLSVLCTQQPEAKAELKDILRRIESGADGAEGIEFLTLARPPQGVRLADDENRIVEILKEGPHSRRELSARCGSISPRLLRTGRLEKMGVVRCCGATPTDALHVLGEFTAFDTEAAELATAGIAHLIGLDATETARLIKRQVQKLLALHLMRRQLGTAAFDGDMPDCDNCSRLIEHLLGADVDSGFELRWRQKRHIVGIGAPVHAYLPAACSMLGGEAVLPPDADVANAVGAATTQVLVREQLSVRPSELGTYLVYAPDGREEFATLHEAERRAREHIVELIRQRGRQYGTAEEQVEVEVLERSARLADGTLQLLELVVAGFLAGAPTAASARSPAQT